MGYIKKFVEFICERQQEDLYDAQKIVLTLKTGSSRKRNGMPLKSQNLMT